MTTAASLLAAVENAIEARLTGGAIQSFSIGGKNIQYMTLDQLRSMRAELKSEVAATSRSTRTYAGLGRPS